MTRSDTIVQLERRGRLLRACVVLLQHLAGSAFGSAVTCVAFGHTLATSAMLAIGAGFSAASLGTAYLARATGVRLTYAVLEAAQRESWTGTEPG